MADSYCRGRVNLQRADAIISSVNSGAELVDNLSRFGSEPQYKKLKGDVFERLTECYLKLEPVFSSQFKHVWHHSDIPIKVRDELRLPSPEIGVDLIGKFNDGTYCAIQCKFHQDPSVNVSYDELKTFFSVTEREETYSKLSHRIVATSAECVSNNVSKVHKNKLGIISAAEFQNLSEAWFSKIHAFIKGQKVALLPFSPRPHQREAVESAIDYYLNQENARGKIIHPCGSGKSLTAYWIAQAFNVQSVLIAVPSLALVKQTLNAWAREAAADNILIEWMAICSDQDVSLNDDPAFQTQELGIAVTTDPSELGQFLFKNNNVLKLVVTTYQSSNVIVESCKSTPFVFDLGVFDEAHKTAGHRSKKFSILLDDINLPISKRIFMTATERQFKGNSTDFLSMDDARVYGDVVHRLSFRSALEQNPPILSDYKIVTIAVSKSEVEEFISDNSYINVQNNNFNFDNDASTFVALIALLKLVEKKKIKHAITFHSSIKRARIFSDITNEISTIANDSDKISSFHVSGKLSTGERNAEISRFIKNVPSTISNARCLTEGIDIPVVDAVVFADPKQSVVDIVQAAGRAMRTHPDKKIGYIVIPVMVDEDSNDLSSEVFLQLINVVAALGMNDDRIIEEVQQYASQGSNNPNPILQFVETAPISSINFGQLVKSIELKSWDRLSFAKSVVGESEFAKWMRDNAKLSEKTIKNYSQAIRKISNDLVKMNMAYSSLNEITENADLTVLKEKYFSIDEYRELDIRGKNMYSAGFNRLIDYQKYKKS